MDKLIRPKGTEQGSPEELATKVKLARDWARMGERDVRELVKYLRDLRERDWRSLVDGADDWPRFCLEAVGYDPDFLAEMEVGVNILEGLGHKGKVSEEQARKALTPHGTNQHANNGQEAGRSVRTSNSRGETSEYLRARLARDRPEISEALERGEYPSARAAGIAAGIVKVPTPLDMGKRAWSKMSKKERTKFLAWLYTPEANEE